MEPKHMLKSDSSVPSSYFPPEPEIKEFYFDDKKIVYVLDVTGTIWIGAIQIMDILRYDNISDAIERYVHEEDVVYFHQLTPKIIGNDSNEEIQENTLFFHPSAIYILVLYSRLDNLRFFIRWMCRVVFPSIENLDRKHEKQVFEETKQAFELAKVENVDLKLQIQTNILIMDQQRNYMKMYERRVQYLEIENRAKDDVLDQQIIDAGVLQDEIQNLKRENQSLIVDNQMKNDTLKQYEHNTENMPKRIQEMENEIEFKNDLVKELTARMEDMSRKNQQFELNMKNKNDALVDQVSNILSLVSRIEGLESINHTKNEELKTLQIQMSLLENENAILKIKAQTEERQVLKRQDALLHLFGKNFVPKLYDKKLDEQFLVFRLNEDNFFTHYAVRSRIRNISQQIKTIQARHPHAVELLRITFYPNEVNLFKLMRNHLKDKIHFKGNFFIVLNDEYNDEDLKNDVLKLFNETENMRQEVFKMMGIERYFKTNENVNESTGFADEINPTNSISVNEITCGECNVDQNRDSPTETSEEGGNTTSGLAQVGEIADVEGGIPNQEHDLKSAQNSEILIDLGNDPDKKIVTDVN